ncbi:MAG: hypothetical protein QM711_06440 [Micropruina sp.]|uniref:hypothetical protein n=1 Tax=Micropruina sp. TaxID=2737536 RepID=UPI0039E5C1A8
MPRRTMVPRLLAAAAAFLVLGLGLGLSVPATGQAVPLPRATTVTASPQASPTASPNPSEANDDPSDDPDDDGTNPMPVQTGTWVAVGAAAAVALLAGLVVALRKR